MPGSSTLRRRTIHHPARSGIVGPLGRACFRHRRLTVIAWIVGVACLITLWTRFGAPAQNDFTGSDPGQTLLNQHFHQQSGDTLTLAIHSTAPVGSPAVRARVTSALIPFTRAPHVTSVTSPYQAAGQISANGHDGLRRRPVRRAVKQDQQRGSSGADAGRQVDVRTGSELLPGRRRGRPGGDTVRRADGRGGRAGGRDRAADRVRLPAGHGAARADRRTGHRRRAVADRPARPRVPGPLVLPDRRLHDRAGGRRGLRAVHRDPVP